MHTQNAMIGGGFTPNQCQSLADSALNLTATGTIQADAKEFKSALSLFATVPANSGALLSRQAQPGDTMLVYNGGANTLKVYPQLGDSINGAAANAPILITPNTPVILACHDSTKWSALFAPTQDVGVAASPTFAVLTLTGLTSPFIPFVGGGGTLANSPLTRFDANTVEQRNGVNPQVYRLTNTFTDAANYERGELAWGSNTLTLRTTQAGTGATRALVLETVGSNIIQFNTNNTQRFFFDQNGVIRWNTDNTLDIAQSGAGRPRTIYVGTSLVIGSVAPGSTISQAAQNDTVVSNHLHAAFGLWVRSSSNDRLTGFESTGAGGPLQVMVNNAEQARVLVVASAVNYVTLAGGATTVGPTLSADGETNIDLQLAAKGTGKLKLLTAGADIQWGKALVALGGGAAPTFGTIGGTGPTVAAQNSWERRLDSTGAVCWAPIWK